MAIVINNTPGLYYSAHGDLIFVVYEATKTADPATYPDYKYVCDVYIDSTLVARIKKFPHPDNSRGVFNVGDIIRAYVSATFNPDATAFLAQEMGLGESFINATLKFGEEYGFTLYTNLTVDSERKYFNYYNTLRINFEDVIGSYLDKVVSARPYAVDVNENDNFTFIPYFPTSTDPITVTINKNGFVPPPDISTIEWGYFSTDPYATVDSETMQFTGSYITGLNSLTLNFTSAGESKFLVLKEPDYSPVKTQWYNTSFNYGTFPDSVFREYTEIDGFRYYVSRTSVVLDSSSFVVVFSNSSPDLVASETVTGSMEVIVTPSAAHNLQILNVSPGLLNQLTPGFINDNVNYYTVQVGATSIYRFNMVCEPRHTIYRLHFMNRFGGFESRNFTKVSRKSLAITKKDFGKLPYTIDSNGLVKYFNSNNVYNETSAVYASQYNEKLTLNTDILTDGEYAWLADLVVSPLIYIESGEYFVPVLITSNNYEVKKQINDKLTNLTIDIEYGNPINAQYR